MRFVIVLLMALAPALAGDWSGFLVDFNCYVALERNVSPGDLNPHADTDMNLEIGYCSAGPKTKTFGVVGENWAGLKFDAAGNARAAALVRGGKRRFFRVAVRGSLDRDTIRVESVRPAMQSGTSSGPRIVRE